MKRKISKIILFFYVGLIGVQCAGNKTARSVNHVVLVWFKAGGDKDLISKVMSETIKLQNIKTVKALHVGRPIPSERDIVDSTFDLGIFMNFNSVEDMNVYLKDPLHIEFFKNNIEGKTKKLVVYDF